MCRAPEVHESRICAIPNDTRPQMHSNAFVAKRDNDVATRLDKIVVELARRWKAKELLKICSVREGATLMVKNYLFHSG